MSDPSLAMPNISDHLIDLIKDGGRRAMYGGDPYEDDVERDTLPMPGTGAKDPSA
jgi:hypothetical protein